MHLFIALLIAKKCFSSRCRDEGDTGSASNKGPEGTLIYFYAKVRSLEEREEKDNLSRVALH
jgi:hypothetical protein